MKDLKKLVALCALAMFAAACGGVGSTGASTSASGDSGEGKPRGGGSKFIVYVTTLNIANAWQEEAKNLALAVARMKPYADKVEVRSQLVDPDPQAQISQVQSMVAAGADAIVAYTVSPTAVNNAFKAACQAGVTVLSFDATVTEPCVYNISYITTTPVGSEHPFMGYNAAEALAKMLNGKGDIFIARGIVGTSTDLVHYNSALAAFKKYPGIKVVATYEGKWDSATQQKEMAKALAAHPNVAGVWAGYGESGVVKALKAAGKQIPVTGETSNYFRQALLAGWPGVSIGSPPAQGGIAMKVALQILTQGGEGVPRDIEVPLNVVSKENVKVCEQDTFAAGCNVFPAGKVGDENTAEIFQPDLLPESSLTAAKTGNPAADATLTALPDLTKYAQDPSRRFVTRQACDDGWKPGLLPEGVQGCLQG